MFLTHQPETAVCVPGAGTLYKSQRSQNVHRQHCTWKPGRRTALVCDSAQPTWLVKCQRQPCYQEKTEKTHTGSTYGPQLKSRSRQGAPSVTAVAAACSLPCRLMALGSILIAMSLLSSSSCSYSLFDKDPRAEPYTLNG